MNWEYHVADIEFKNRSAKHNYSFDQLLIVLINVYVPPKTTPMILLSRDRINHFYANKSI